MSRESLGAFAELNRTIEVVNQLDDRDFLLLHHSVAEYFCASPPRPPSDASRQLVQTEIDKVVTQIDQLWVKQREQLKLADSLGKNPFRLWDNRYSKAVAQLEKIMETINQSIAQKEHIEAKLEQWDKQELAHQAWEKEPRTIEMRLIAEVFQLPQMLERLTTIRQQQQEQKRQAALKHSQQQQQEQNQQPRRGLGR